MPFLSTGDCVLLVIDAQESFYQAGRAGAPGDEAAAVIDRVAWVTAVARELAVPIVVTEEDAARNGPTVAKVAAELPLTAPVLPKDVFAVPDNPGIAAAVQATGARSAVLAGTETDVCIAHSALRLAESGFRVAVVENAVYSPGDAHRSGLARMRSAGIELLSAKELLYDWLPSLAQVRSFCAAHPQLSSPPGFSL